MSVVFFSQKLFTGSSCICPIGSYPLSQTLQAFQTLDKGKIGSVKVPKSLQMTIFKETNFGGDCLTIQSDCDLPQDWQTNANLCSWKIFPSNTGYGSFIWENYTVNKQQTTVQPAITIKPVEPVVPVVPVVPNVTVVSNSIVPQITSQPPVNTSKFVQSDNFDYQCTFVSNNIIINFKSTTGISQFVDLHYQIATNAQQNVRMKQDTTDKFFWTWSIPVIDSKLTQNIKYSFTYFLTSGMDSPQFAGPT